MRGTLFAILTCLTLTSCDQKDLDHCQTLRADFNVRYNREWQVTEPGAIDWECVWNECGFGMTYSSLVPQIPDGLRAVVYDNESLIAQYNISPDGGHVYLDDDDNSVLLFNNDSEYIVYVDLSTISDATATTRSVQRSTYQGSPFVRNAPRLVNPPDMLYNAFIEEVDEDELETHVKVVMQPVVYTYLIRYKFTHGLDYVAIARGALAGMASDVWLESGIAGMDAATVIYDCELTEWGVQAIVRSFGAPSFSPDQTYGLNLEVRLKNGKILDFDFDVTPQLVFQPKGGVIEVGGIEIPDEVGREDPGVFDVTVEGWGEFEDIPIPL